MSINSMFVLSSNELGQFESVVAARLFGAVNAVVIGGSITMLIAVVVRLTSPKLREMEYQICENEKIILILTYKKVELYSKFIYLHKNKFKNYIVMSDITSRVKAIIADKLDVEETEVTPEASFTNDLGADSLDTVELIM